MERLDFEFLSIIIFLFFFSILYFKNIGNNSEFNLTIYLFLFTDFFLIKNGLYKVFLINTLFYFCLIFLQVNKSVFFRNRENNRNHFLGTFDKLLFKGFLSLSLVVGLFIISTSSGQKNLTNSQFSDDLFFGTNNLKNSIFLKFAIPLVFIMAAIYLKKLRKINER